MKREYQCPDCKFKNIAGVVYEHMVLVHQLERFEKTTQNILGNQNLLNKLVRADEKAKSSAHVTKKK